MRPRRGTDRIRAGQDRGVDLLSVGPTRTCVGCRKRAPASHLLRFVAADSGGDLRLLPDTARRLPGRGAHLHPDPACFAQAERRRAFGRALRLSGFANPELLAEHIRTVSVPCGTTDDEASALSSRPSKVGRPR
ncbi:YlxR family protein [Actinoplanes sp. NEAU-A12]|uniref:YlxR family protein n=1 Tax=Actinoplanes sandaracinus TaxID=3045177 RepID=A0ABT6WCW0_9ACTN|nr:YlxR family protein [Actinoplanes sandaracinus]